MNKNKRLSIISIAVSAAMILFSANASAISDAEAKQLAVQANNGDAASLQTLQQDAMSGDAVSEDWYGGYFVVKKDYAQASQWYRKASDQGDADAQTNLGLLYTNGQGVAQDYAQAVQWYRKAADQGLASAQSNLGVMYKKGQYVPQNNIIAYALYNLAASNSTTASSNREGLIKDMSEEEITAGQLLTQKMTSTSVTQAIDGYSRKESKPAKRINHKITKPMARQQGSQWPDRPAHQPGVTSCNTQCTNGDCYRTYDTGRHIHLNVPPSFDSFTNKMKFETPPC